MNPLEGKLSVRECELEEGCLQCAVIVLPKQRSKEPILTTSLKRNCEGEVGLRAHRRLHESDLATNQIQRVPNNFQFSD